MEAEPSITLLLDEHVFAADKRDGRIVSVTSRNARTSIETTFRGEVFIDASGRAALAKDNQPGPCIGGPENAVATKVAQLKAGAKMVQGIKRDHMFPPEEVIHIFPGTHYWEYGQYLDMDAPGNEELVRDHTEFSDAIVRNDGAFCLHYPGDEQYDFRLKKWVWDVRDQKPYSIPFRCLYSKNVPNLMMAGKHISVSRVVSSSIKMMANGAEHGVATGCAATLCRKYGCFPREIGADHFDELKSMVDTIS